MRREMHLFQRIGRSPVFVRGVQPFSSLSLPWWRRSDWAVSQRPLTLILLQKYRDTNGRRIVIQIGGVYTTLCQEEGILLQKYRDRNGRCIAILFRSIGVRGRFDSHEFHGLIADSQSAHLQSTRLRASEIWALHQAIGIPILGNASAGLLGGVGPLRPLCGVGEHLKRHLKGEGGSLIRSRPSRPNQRKGPKL